MRPTNLLILTMSFIVALVLTGCDKSDLELLPTDQLQIGTYEVFRIKIVDTQTGEMEKDYFRGKSRIDGRTYSVNGEVIVKADAIECRYGVSYYVQDRGYGHYVDLMPWDIEPCLFPGNELPRKDVLVYRADENEFIIELIHDCSSHAVVYVKMI